DGAARARPHHERELRNHPRALHVAPEDLRVACQRDDAFLDASATGVVDPDDGTAELHGEVHHLADLLREDLAQGTAEHGEVLREDEDLPTEDRAVARDDRIAVGPPLEHPEVRLTMAHVAIELDERTRIQQLDEALAREQLSLLALPLDCLLGAGVLGLVAQLLKPVELRLGGIGARLVCRSHGRERTPRLWHGATSTAQSHF